MGSTAWAAVLMVTIAVVIAGAFVLLWVRDKDRADEVADDPQRTDTGQTRGPAVDESAEDAPGLRSQRRS